MKNGFCRVPRSIEEGLSNGTKAQAMGLFVWLLLHARIKDGEVNGIAVRRGQLCLSVSDLAAEMGLTYNKTRYTLGALCTANLITKQRAHRTTFCYTLITICNYDSYNGTAPADDSLANAPHCTSTCNIKGERKEEKAREEREKSSTTTAMDFGVSQADDTAGRIPVGRLAAVLLSQGDWATTYCANHDLTAQQMAALVRRFVTHLQDRGTTDKPLSDAKSHFCNWHAKLLDADRQRTIARQEAQETARKQSLARYEEQRAYEEAERRRRQQEEEERKQRHIADLRAAAQAGNKVAIAMIEKYGI